MQNTKKYLQKIKSFLNYKAPFNCGWNENGLGCKKQCIDCKLLHENLPKQKNYLNLKNHD
jgi:hypothetical protein